MSKALITGVCGQDGAYLARSLYLKGYEVSGFDLGGSSVPALGDAKYDTSHINLIHGDITDVNAIGRVVSDLAPDEIYHLAGASHVGQSFDDPENAMRVNGYGTQYLLEAITAIGNGYAPHIFLASSAEIFGPGTGEPMDETRHLNPQNPYAVSKAFAFELGQKYRSDHGLHISNGILFNHESPLRGPNFVTRKITQGVAAIQAGTMEALSLGNLDAARDWGHAEEYVEGMWKMLQQDAGEDYVLATGQAHSIRDCAEMAFSGIGIDLFWKGTGVDEVAVEASSDVVKVRVDPAFFRPLDSPTRLGNASKAAEKLNWRAKTPFARLVREMLEADQALIATRH